MPPLSESEKSHNFGITSYLEILFLSEMIFNDLPECCECRENLFAQDRIYSYTDRMYSLKMSVSGCGRNGAY